MSTRDAFDAAHAQRAAQAVQTLRAAAAAPLALAKSTSNLFRNRIPASRVRLDLGALQHVLGADTREGWVDVEGMTTYEALAEWCLRHSVIPAVVPQFKTVTVGGAVAGIGIEATSFRHGLVHHTMRELEVLTPGGDVVICTPDNEHRDLFFGFPNSYGCLGYALRVRLATLRARPFVRVQHLHLSEGEVFLAAMRAACAGDSDFVDGVVFGPREYVLSTGRFVERAPWRSDYTYERIYWQAVRDRMEDYLSAADYLWRWDTDWFWGSRHFGAQHRIVRQLLGRKRLNSRTWGTWMRCNARRRVTERIAAMRGLYRERVIQDADIPMQHALEFLAFLEREIGILPVWVCPVRADLPGERFDLYPLDRAPLYVNFGFWDVLQTQEPHEPAHFNRSVEAEVRRLGGIKSLYSDSFFTPEEFGAAYGMEKYRALKQRYDPQGRAPDLYDKCVAGA